MKYDKINLNRAPLTADEINSAMDFDGVLNPNSTAISSTNTGGKLLKFSMYSVVAIGIGILGVYLYNQTPEVTSEQPQVEQAVIVEASNAAHRNIDKALLNPPVEGYEKEFKTAKVNAQTGGKVRLGSSDVIIPPNAFINADGSPVKGDVELKYKEYTDVLDIFLSGIPMEYDSAGVNYTFVSNGMFELQGFQKGTEVKIAPEKNLEVKMEIAERRSGFSDYFLNPETGKWEFRNGQQYEVEEAQNSELIAQNDRNEEAELFETDKGFINGENPAIKEKILALERTVEKVEKEKKKLQKPVKPKKADPAIPQVQLDVDYADFPELQAFKNTLFQVAEDDIDDFSLDFGKEIWTDVDIKKSAKAGYYKMVFSKPGRREVFKATPVLKEADLANALTTYDTLFEKYENSLDSLETVKKQKEAALAQAREQAKKEAEEQQRLWKEQAEEQRRVWEEQAAQQRRDNMARLEAQRGVNATSSKVLAVFQLSQFGTYNCDAPRTLPRGKEVLADYRGASDQALTGMVYLVEEGKRAIYKYYPGYSKLKYNPSNKNLLLTVTPENRLAVLQPEEFKDIDTKSSKCVIKMKECDKELVKKSEIEAYIKDQGFDI